MATKSIGKGASSASKKKRPRWVRRLQIFGLLGFIFASAAVIAGWVFWAAKVKEVRPKLALLTNVRQSLDISPTQIISSDGKVLYEFVAEKREWVNIDDVPKLVQDATIAAEDKRFYQHHGVDYVAGLKKVFTTVKEGEVSGGASTITMQLAKRLFSDSEQTVNRKIQDMAIATEIEKTYDKKHILEMYLNQVYYGSYAYGIKKAAEVYFDKSLDELTAAEAAMLSRCVRRPSSQNPFKNLEVSTKNRNVVLKLMLEEGMITQSVYDSAIKEKVKLSKRPPSAGERSTKQAPYFVDYILKELQDKPQFQDIDVEAGGYKIYTTLDTRLQKISDQQVRRLVDRNRGARITTGAFLLLNSQGKIMAMTGGYDYDRNQFNVVSQGRRQPGSSFKPFVYSLALEQRVIGPSDVLSNDNRTFRLAGNPPYSPRNSSGKYGGPVDIGTAVAFSINVPAVDALYRYGKSRGLNDFSKRCRTEFGFESKIHPYLSSALGASEVSPIEMARGFSTFMLSGGRFEPFGITKVLGPNQEVLYTEGQLIKRGVVRADVCDLVDSYMRGVVTRGTARAASGITNARGKTGTTSDNKDAWFCGYTDKFMGIGWIANERIEKRPDGTKRAVYDEMNRSVFGGTYTVQIWTGVMREAQRIYGEKPNGRGAPSVRWSGEVDMDRDPNADEDPQATPADTADQNPDGEGTPVDRPGRTPEVNPPIGPDTDPASNPDAGTTDPPKKPVEADPKPPRDQGRQDNPPRNDPPEEGGGTVTVVICADTGMVAKDSCPEKTPRTYRKGRQPKRACTKH